MTVDHSLTYRRRSLRNFFHRRRLNHILKLVRHYRGRIVSYADFGCSNGYLTAQIATEFGASKVVGFDHSAEHVEAAAKQYSEYEFRLANLNQVDHRIGQFDFVTCLETLEHTGNLANAVANVTNAIAPGGHGLLSVPIEIGPVGIAKYVAKVGVYGYSLEELPHQHRSRRKYLTALLAGRRISSFRNEKLGWGTHFGFDYRDVDEQLSKMEGLSLRTLNRGTTHFVLISKSGESVESVI